MKFGNGHPGTRGQPIGLSKSDARSELRSCGIAIMAKASIPGRAKTRLVPPLTLDEAAAFNTAFLQDMADNLLIAGRQADIRAYVAFGPPGSDEFFRRTLPDAIELIDVWLPDFGDCLLRAIGEILRRRHDSAVVLNSDSPTLPTSFLVEAADVLAQPGDRAVLGPSSDGGYYLLGLKKAHRRMFEDIEWSTEAVAEQTLDRAQELNLDVHVLPTWYDVDDVQSVRDLYLELSSPKTAQSAEPYNAPHTAVLLRRLSRDASLVRRIERIHAIRGTSRMSSNDGIAVQPQNGRINPRRYFENAHAVSHQPDQEPVCLYLEVTNRCNLLCTTCPRTYEELEPPADMSWELFTSIVDQIPRLQRAVLHGVGEPMLVKNLPRMVRYLKDRDTYVLFNTNGTVLNERNGRALIDASLDELRVSFDASNAKTYAEIRGKNYFNRILKNVRAFRDLQEREGHDKPRVSAWLTGLRETIAELPEFVRVAADTGVKEVYLQRLVFYDKDAIGKARPDQALYERLTRDEAIYIDNATTLAKSLGVTFSASGAASDPGLSLKRSDAGSPWSLCRRPWTLMYFTANGRALPCCIAPFSQRGYEHYTLGDATQQTLREIWTGPGYSEFRKALLSDRPPAACANCGLRWSL